MPSFQWKYVRTHRLKGCRAEVSTEFSHVRNSFFRSVGFSVSKTLKNHSFEACASQSSAEYHSVIFTACFCSEFQSIKSFYQQRSGTLEIFSHLRFQMFLHFFSYCFKSPDGLPDPVVLVHKKSFVAEEAPRNFTISRSHITDKIFHMTTVCFLEITVQMAFFTLGQDIQNSFVFGIAKKHTVL